MNEPQHKKVNIGLVKRPVPPVREFFNEAELSRLVASIRENGLMQPIMVRSKNGEYEVIDGDRRLQACWEAGLREISVVVHDLDDQQTHIQRMLANLDRHDPDPVSEAKYIAKIIHDKLFTPEEFATKLGRSLNWISDRLAIAEMPAYMQNALSTEQASLGLCLELQQIHDENTKERYFREALRNGMTVHSAKINRLMVNEAIDSLAEQNETPTEENIPAPQIIPKVRCELTHEILPVTATRMIRVGIDNFERWRKDLAS